MTNDISLHCMGRCDGMGDLNPAGSYVRVVYRIPGVDEHYIRLSEGEAELLAAELHGALGRPAPSTEGLREWQPIETAPKDGTSVLLWWRFCKEPSVGWFATEEGSQNSRSGWRCEGDACIPKNQGDCTHWMPLPAAPDAARTALAGVTAPVEGA